MFAKNRLIFLKFLGIFWLIVGCKERKSLIEVLDTPANIGVLVSTSDLENLAKLLYPDSFPKTAVELNRLLFTQKPRRIYKRSAKILLKYKVRIVQLLYWVGIKNMLPLFSTKPFCFTANKTPASTSNVSKPKKSHFFMIIQSIMRKNCAAIRF